MPNATDNLITQKNIEERLAELVEQELWGQAGAELSKFDPVDVATHLSRYDGEELVQLFKNLPDSLKPDVLADLPQELATELVTELPAPDTADIANDMAPDDAADVLGELDKNISAKIIEGMDKQTADDVRRLMTYPEDSAGGIMTTDLLRLRKEQTVREALDAVAQFTDEERIYQVYVTDEKGLLLGSVTVWDLLRQRDRTKTLNEIMDRDLLTVRSDRDQEFVAQVMSKYDLTVIPVVDDRGILLGRVTHDDAVDVVKAEADEDIFHLAGTDNEDMGNLSAWRSCRYRLPWLMVTLLGGLLTAWIMCAFNTAYKFAAVFVAFVPSVMAMGGSVGIQSSVLTVRELTSGEEQRHAPLRLFLHELRTGALLGVIMGVSIFLCSMLITFLTPAGKLAVAGAVEGSSMPATSFALRLGLSAGFALLCAMSFAAAFGALIPMFLKRLRIDPSATSGPFVSALNDIIAMLIYYGICMLFLTPLAN